VVAGVAALVLALTLGVARLGGAVVDAARAQTAADAAALAAVEGGAVAAERLAEMNGARLVSCVCDSDPVEVTVIVGRARAVARASGLP
jgi:Flp pilus assembly protein TadG